MSGSTRKSGRDFLAEAASEVEALVTANPSLERRTLYEMSQLQGGAAAEWLDGVAEAARRREYGRLLQYATAVTKSGQKVRLLQSYTKFVQTDDGQEKQLRLWKHLDQMTRDEATLAIAGLDTHIVGSIESRNAVVEYWNTAHPKAKPLQMRIDFK